MRCRKAVKEAAGDGLFQNHSGINRKINLIKESKKIYIKIKDLLLRAGWKRLSPAASITVEASFALPLFLFFFINLLCVFDILRFQCDMEAALHQTGTQIFHDAGLASAAVSGNGGSAAKGVISTAYASRKVKAYLGSDYLESSSVRSGAGGLSFAESALHSDGDIVDIVVTYKAKSAFGIASFTDIPMESRFYGHAFTGYDAAGKGDGEEEEAEEMVFITRHGTAYHRSIDCSHLKLNIRSVSKADVKAERSKDGSKYYPCEYCGKRAAGMVYIADYGNRYHTSRTCSGIKREIMTVPISEVGGRSPCRDCG